jgi:hypothetical protein
MDYIRDIAKLYYAGCGVVPSSIGLRYSLHGWRAKPRPENPWAGEFWTAGLQHLLRAIPKAPSYLVILEHYGSRTPEEEESIVDS